MENKTDIPEPEEKIKKPTFFQYVWELFKDFYVENRDLFLIIPIVLCCATMLIFVLYYPIYTAIFLFVLVTIILFACYKNAYPDEK